MKKISTIILPLLMIVMLLGGAALAEAAGVVSPVFEYESYEELLEDTGIPMADAPEGATDVTYVSIDGEPFVTQIEFTLDGNDYTYRAAFAENGEIAEAMQVDVHGVYMNAPTVETRILGNEGLEYTIATENDSVVLSWYVEELETQYSLFSATAGEEALSQVLVQLEDVPVVGE